MSSHLNYHGKVIAVSYLVGERLIRLFVGFFIHAWMARSLSPGDFGFISYVVKGVAVYYTFGLFGSDEIVIREFLSRKVENKKDVLKTVFYMRFGIGLFGLVLMSLISGVVSGFGTELWLWMLIFGCTIPFQAFTVYELPFISEMKMKPVFYARNGSYFVGVTAKVFGLIRQFQKNSFVFIYILEELSWKIFVYVLALKNDFVGGNFSKPIFDIIWRSGFLNLLAGFIILFDQRVPFLMLDYLGHFSLIGQYSVAIALLDIALLIPISLASALFPSVAQGKMESQESYEFHRQVLANWLVWAGLAFALSVYFTSPLIVKFLYGDKYIEVIPFLKGISFSAILSSFNVGRFKWFVLEDRLVEWIQLISLGLGIQAICLYIFIPLYGLQGVIFSCLAGQIMPNLIFVRRRIVRESIYIFFKSFKFK